MTSYIYSISSMCELAVAHNNSEIFRARTDLIDKQPQGSILNRSRQDTPFVRMEREVFGSSRVIVLKCDSRRAESLKFRLIGLIARRLIETIAHEESVTLTTQTVLTTDPYYAVFLSWTSALVPLGARKSYGKWMDFICHRVPSCFLMWRFRIGYTSLSPTKISS